MLKYINFQFHNLKFSQIGIMDFYDTTATEIFIKE